MRPLPPADDPRVQALPDDLRPLVLAALAAMPPYYANRRDGYRLRVALWKEVLEAAGFPFNRFDYGRKILASAQYSERQKAVALLLADVPGVDPIEYPLHMRAWVQRQFLGLDPPGLLFDVVGEETLFDFFRVLAVKNKPAALGWVSSLPIGRRLEVIGELMLAGDCSDYDLSLLLAPLWPELKDEGRSWAPVYADRLLTFFEDARGGEIHTSFGPRLRGDLAITVLLALVRAEIPIEPRWDTLFEMWLVNVETVPWEIVEALPEVRRPLAVRRIAEGGDRNYLRRWGGPLLRRYPWETVAAYLLSRAEDMEKPRDFLKEMKAIAKTSDGVALALAAYDATHEKIPKLKLADRSSVKSLADLDEIACAQLVEANRLYGGLTMTAEAIMQNSGDVEPVGEPQITVDFLFRARVIGARKVHLYDVYFYNVDSGTFFKKGTAEVVAELIQGSVESSNQALAQALSQAMSS